MENEDRVIAETILQQLGGNRFAVMTGSKNFMRIAHGLIFDLSRNMTSANCCEITLNGLDLYDIKFYLRRQNHKTWDVTKKVIREYYDVYAEMLPEIFTETTGMYTRLF